MIVATAGHVDHGKTALVKSLTGVDADRLAEEKRRGLSIELGFAYRRVAAGNPDAELDYSIGFIDVPGHKRFINAMIAGVGGIDLGLLVVAADDGIMPQTREHLEVMRLLGIVDYALAITKIDRVDGARVEKVREETLALLSSLTEKPVLAFPVSNASGAGLEDLQAFLDGCARRRQAKPARGIFRLPIDRVFVLKGVGLVVAGTVAAGRLAVGGSARLLPQDRIVRVRGIYAQNRPAEWGRAGLRCAVNIACDGDRKDIGRGNWLVGLDACKATSRFSARLELATSSPLRIRNLMPVKLHIDACRVAAKMSFIASGQPIPWQDPSVHQLVQISTERPISCRRGDRFLLRDYSESFTLGGGVALDPLAPRIRALSAEQRDFLCAMEEADFASALRRLAITKHRTVDFDGLRRAWNLSADEVNEILDGSDLARELRLAKVDGFSLVTSRERWQWGRRAVLDAVRRWHAACPESPGIMSGELAEQLPWDLDDRLMSALLDELQRDGSPDAKLELAGGMIRVAGFAPRPSSRAREQWQRVEGILQDRGCRIPLLAELERESRLSRKEIMATLSPAVKAGRVYRISQRRYGLPATLLQLAEEVQELARTRPRFTAIDYKRRIAAGRNYAIELLECFDAIGFTQRQGNERIVLDAEAPARIFVSRKSDVPGGMPGLQSQRGAV